MYKYEMLNKVRDVLPYNKFPYSDVSKNKVLLIKTNLDVIYGVDKKTMDKKSSKLGGEIVNHNIDIYLI